MVSLHNCPGREPNSYPGIQLTCGVICRILLHMNFLLLTERLEELSTEYVMDIEGGRKKGEMKVSRRSSARRRNVSGGSWNGGNRQEVGHFLFFPLFLFDIFLGFLVFCVSLLISLDFLWSKHAGVLCGIVVQPLP